MADNYIFLKNFLNRILNESMFPATNRITLICILIGILAITYIILLIIPKRGKCCLGFALYFVILSFVFSQYVPEVRKYDLDMGIDEPVKIVQLSDLHCNTTFSYSIYDAINKCNKEKPDIVVITGDFKTDINGNDLTEETFRYLKKIRCNRIYAVLGNHDNFKNKKKMIRSFADSGVKIIDEKKIKVRDDFYILGAAYDGVTGHKIEKALKQLPADSKAVILTHNPASVLLKYYDTKYMKKRDVLFLTGHTHGGQVLFPWSDRKKIAQTHFFIDFLDGMTETEGNRLYISKGIGTTYFPIRMNSKPEIAVFNIR